MIKKISLALLVMIAACDQPMDNRPIYDDTNLLDYVSYALLLNSNDEPITDPNDPTEPFVKSYTHTLYDTIHIPISMTRKDASTSVSVSLKNTVFGDDQNIRFSPDSIIVFGENKHRDTIDVIFDQRWFTDVKDSIVMEILSSSDSNMFIGYPYGDSLNNALTISLGELEFPMTTSSPYSYDITAGETPSFTIAVEFENGFILDEIEGEELWSEVSSTLNYTLEQQDFEPTDNKINYTFTLNEAVTDKYTDQSTILELAEINGYQVSGNSTVEFLYTGLALESFTLVDDFISIQGDMNETIEIDISFAAPINANTADIINTNGILVESSSSMQYQLELEAVSAGDSIVRYRYTLLEELATRNSELFETILKLQTIEGYELYGNTIIEIEKSPLNTGDASINPAAHFYNNTTPTTYSLFYTFLWFDYGSDGDCDWRESFMHTYPVEVDATHPDAVLHANGNYYHAYRFGFKSPTAGRTTNALTLKLWFDDEYTDEDLSPGFNIPEAIELFPKDGTSHTEGIVKIVEQDLQITGDSRNTFIFGLSGNGTYSYDEGSYEIYRDSIYSIEMEISLYNEELYGGFRTKKYHMKNRDLDSTEKPEDLDRICYPPITL